MNKHTEGKWEIKKWADGSLDVIKNINEKRFETVCQVTSTPEAEANAKLIATAPDLLEALHFLLENRNYPKKHLNDSFFKKYAEATSKAESAIKKATE